jgi:hypothetical protein
MTLNIGDITRYLACITREETSMTLHFAHVTLHFVDLKRYQAKVDVHIIRNTLHFAGITRHIDGMARHPIRVMHPIDLLTLHIVEIALQIADMTLQFDRLNCRIARFPCSVEGWQPGSGTSSPHHPISPLAPHSFPPHLSSS